MMFKIAIVILMMFGTSFAAKGMVVSNHDGNVVYLLKGVPTDGTFVSENKIALCGLILELIFKGFSCNGFEFKQAGGEKTTHTLVNGEAVDSKDTNQEKALLGFDFAKNATYLTFVDMPLMNGKAELNVGKNDHDIFVHVEHKDLEGPFSEVKITDPSTIFTENADILIGLSLYEVEFDTTKPVADPLSPVYILQKARNENGYFTDEKAKLITKIDESKITLSS